MRLSVWCGCGGGSVCCWILSVVVVECVWFWFLVFCVGGVCVFYDYVGCGWYGCKGVDVLG